MGRSSGPATESYTCIGCPLGCPLALVHVGREIHQVSGEQCKRGSKYARQEFTDPRRTFSTTVPIRGALYERLPVKLSSPVPKDRILEAAREVQRIRVTAPVRLGDVLMEGVLGEAGVDVLACRTMDEVRRA